MRWISLLGLFWITAISACTNPSLVFAQGLLTKLFPPSTFIGFHGGTSISSESLSEIKGGAFDGLKFGFSGGLNIDHWFNGNWALCTGLSLTQKGVDESYFASDVGLFVYGDDKYWMNFVEVPILLKASLVRSGVASEAIRPFIFAGPTFGFLVSSSARTSGNIAPISNLKTYLRNFGYSLYFGTGAMFKLGDQTLFFDTGYETGLTNIFASEPPRSFYNRTGQTTSTANAIIATIGLMWEL